LSFLSKLNKKFSSITRFVPFIIILTLFSLGNAFGQPTVTFNSANSNGDEAVGPVSIRVILSEISALDVNVYFSVGGTASNGTDYTMVSTSPLTIAAGNTEGYITFNVTDDSLNEADETVLVTLASADNAVLGTPDEHTYTINDNDTLNFVVDTDPVGVPEGGTATFGVKLSTQPSSDVNAAVARDSGDTDISVTGGASLSFTSENWDTYQIVTLAGAQDVDVVNGTATIRVSATGILNKDVTANEQDDDTLSFVTSTDAVDVAESNTATFQVKLSAQPSSDVSVTVTRVSGDSDITVSSGASLTFTSTTWDTFQPVTLAAAEDPDVENGVATIRISATGVPNKDITATEQDNDTLNFVVDTDPVGVPEGGAATFGVKLSAQPSSDVNATVARNSGDTDISVTGGASLNFTSENWDTFQIVTLAGAQDVDVVDGTATIRISATGIPNKDVTANEQDDDTLNFVTSTDAVDVTEGSTASFQVKLSAQPSSDVSVTVARVSGDNSSSGHISGC
jgi:hypothetical protein